MSMRVCKTAAKFLYQRPRSKCSNIGTWPHGCPKIIHW